MHMLGAECYVFSEKTIKTPKLKQEWAKFNQIDPYFLS